MNEVKVVRIVPKEIVPEEVEMRRMMEARVENRAASEPRGSQTKRLRLAELTSGLGAGVLGLGIGVLIAGFLRGLGLPILIAALLLHTWGMADKHRLEAEQAASNVWWSTFLYWICWVFLGALAVYVVARALGG